MNINDYVWVRLNSEGATIANAFYCHPHHPIPKFEPGLKKFQLWELMQIFGPPIHLGGPSFFEDNEIHFEEPTT